jgi:hypothetical protein
LYTGECDWERMALVTPTIRPFILPTEIPRTVARPETLMDGDEEKIDCG